MPTVPGSETSITGRGGAGTQPLVCPGTRAGTWPSQATGLLSSCKREMRTWRQGGWGQALLGEATAIQKAVIPDQGATSEAWF